MTGIYFATVQQVFAPGSPFNYNKYQYEYSLLVTTDLYAQMPVMHAVKSDQFGAPDDFDDVTLNLNQKVLVMFPRGDLTSPIIVGAIRNSPTKTADALGYHWLRRFNKTQQGVDLNGNWSVVQDSGPSAQVNTSSVVLDDSVGDSITLDKSAKTLTIKGNALNIMITGDATISVNGAVNLTCDSLEANVSGDAKVTAGSLEANVSGDAEINASGNVKVSGTTIQLNGVEGNVVTTATYPVDYLTGIPILGSVTVTAGS